MLLKRLLSCSGRIFIVDACIWEHLRISRIKVLMWYSRSLSNWDAIWVHEELPMFWCTQCLNLTSFLFLWEAVLCSTLQTGFLFCFASIPWQSEQLVANELPNWIAFNFHILFHFYQIHLLFSPSCFQTTVCHILNLHWLKAVRDPVGIHCNRDCYPVSHLNWVILKLCNFEAGLMKNFLISMFYRK